MLSAQESLHLSVDRLAGDVSNPLNADIEAALERVENDLDGQSASYISGTLC